MHVSNKKKTVVIVGIWLASLGVALHPIMDVGFPESATMFSIPILIVGTALLIGSHFVSEKEKK
ncbi:hypothetical protein AB3N04_04520 [Alkalihalophilus sp. As8PL]|uniref:Group-specific protein n=1 Tax=Alkalihalophilus sp. As8PL TaxID=3237103 RepID=A0AB39BVJ2_9BACI